MRTISRSISLRLRCSRRAISSTIPMISSGIVMV